MNVWLRVMGPVCNWATSDLRVVRRLPWWAYVWAVKVALAWAFCGGGETRKAVRDERR
jgi:hypothetical protein